MTRCGRLLPVAFVLAACGPGGSAAEWTAEERQILSRLEWTADAARTPSDPTNRFADDPRAIALGRRLFHDPSFSRDGDVSCATCHVSERFFSDGLPVADVGLSGNRNTPTIVGAAHSPWLFWDGRKDGLWSQALGPIENPIEHDFTRVEVARVLAAAYRDDWEALFGPLPPLDDARFPQRAKPDPFDMSGPDNTAWSAMSDADRASIDRSFANFGKAIAAWERTLTFQRAPFDEYVRAVQEDRTTDALSADAIAGLRLFIGQAKCINCHDGPRFTDDGFHNLGLPPGPGQEGGEPGRLTGARQVLADAFNCRSPLSDAADVCAELDHLDPSFPDFAGAHRTPSLRNVKQTPPYMHQGQLATLEDVVAFYDELPGEPLIGHRELTLEPLKLSATQRRQLVAFLESLSGPPPVDFAP